MNILLIQYKMIGDVLTSTIIAEQLKLLYPNAHIDYLISKTAHAVVEKNPVVDQCICVSNNDFDNWSGIISLAKQLKKNNYDISIDAYGKNNSALLSKLVGAKKRIGYKKWFSGLAYTNAVENHPDPAVYKTGLSLGSRMLLTTPLSSDVEWYLSPKIYLSTKEIDEGKNWLLDNDLDVNQSITMISALGSCEDKTLPLDYMAQVIDHLISCETTQVLFNYLPSQKDRAQQIYNKCLPQTQKHIFINAIAPSLRDFLKVLHHCTGIIGNEGGAINMSKALGIPSFSIFSPWINKQSWNAGENGSSHVSIHLKDLKPNLYNKKDASAFHKQTKELYKELKPEMMFSTLEKFIKKNY